MAKERLAFLRRRRNLPPMPVAKTFRDPTPADLEMLREEMVGSPLPRKALQGIADMQVQVKQLTYRKQDLLDRLQHGAAADDPGWGNLAELNRQLKEAQERLVSYQH